MIEDFFSKAEQFRDHIKDYIKAKLDEAKLDIAEKTSRVIAALVAAFAVALLFVLFFLFVNIGIALLIGAWIGKTWAGFLIISGLYLLAGIITWTSRNRLIGIPVINKIIGILFKKENEDEKDQKP